jgi:hypothetical protein
MGVIVIFLVLFLVCGVMPLRIPHLGGSKKKSRLHTSSSPIDEGPFPLDDMLIHGLPIDKEGKVSLSSSQLSSYTSPSPTPSPPGLLRRVVRVDDELSVSVFELSDPSKLVHQWMDGHR